MESLTKIANFLFEVGSLRKIPRSHRQTLFTEDMTDNISSHSFRVTWIGWFLAKLEKADPYKVCLMCLLHDITESRSGDQNWVNKKYIKVFDEEIISDQLSSLPFSEDLLVHLSEYEKKITKEAKIAKDADILDQILLLKEHSHSGNREAESWLHLEDFENKSQQFKSLTTKSAKILAKKIVKSNIHDWWKDVWTKERR